MKKFLLMVCMCLCALATMAQERRVTGVVYSKEDGQPMVGAEVTVDDTSLSTVTDIDGRFIFKNVPADARQVKVASIGMVTMRARIPQKEEDEIQVVMESAERKFSPFVKAGVLLSGGIVDEDTEVQSGFGFTAGVGASIYLTRYFSLTPSLNIQQKSIKINDINYKPVYLQLPILVESKIWLKRRGYGNRLLFNYGPYVAYGIAGETDGMKLFSKDGGTPAPFKRFDAGIHLGFGAQLKHFYAGINLEASFLNTWNKDYAGEDPSLRFVTMDLSVGYRF